MRLDEARAVARRVLQEVAPHRDPDAVGPDETLQEALDLDSLDFLHFVVRLHERTGVEIPERDYPQLTTLEGCASYLHRHVNGATDARDPAPLAGAAKADPTHSTTGKGATTWTSN